MAKCGSRSTIVQIRHLRILKLKFIGCSCLYLTLGLHSSALAQPSLIPSAPEVCQVDLAALKSIEPGTDANIVTADTASPRGTTSPSLWWPSEQFSSKLVTNWIADRTQKQIYLLVGAKSWHLLDYIDRYQTIDRFGRVAHSYGYNLNICDSQKIALARYTCDVAVAPTQAQATTAPTTPATCQIWLSSNDRNGMGVQTTSPPAR
jgi:hypothetical protein